MRLRSLQIKGFKSFANETILNFDEDVIGVVGPNGSGKSNIVDAVRWVLGEQKSKELRLEAMSDVIFNGTKTRKESGLAQVTLVFDNTKHILPTEYQSVSVSRLLYRTGESEYRLNNVPCRLKDVRSLFVDTGIGSNSYAIIALGMVDDILDDKENARRKMFEQASGISKYKSRKRETLNKLKNTTADLDRIEDLLFEIDGNLKSLERQAKRTKKYFEYKDKYKEISIKHALISVSKLKDDFKEIKTKITRSEDDYREIDSKLKLAESDLEKIKATNLSKEQSLSQSQKDLNTLVSNIRNLESDKQLNNQKLEFKNQESSNLNQEIIILDERRKTLNQSLKVIEDRVITETNLLQNLKNRVEEAKIHFDKKKADWNKVKTSMDEYSRKKEYLQKTSFDLEKNIAVLENSIDNTKQDINSTFSKIESLNNQKTEVDSTYNTLFKQVASKQNIIQSIEKTIKDRKESIELLKNRIQQDKDALANLYRKKDAVQNEFDLLKSMVDSYEGFPASIKFLSTKWNKKAPILSDVIEVKDEYKSIIEQYLDQYLNHYIVNNLYEAKTAIKLLNDHNKGKASFFLSDAFDAAEVNIKEIIPGCIPAIEVIYTDTAIQPIVSKLLENTYIYDATDQDLPWMNNYPDYTFLDKNGVFIRSLNSISGGSVGLFEGKKIGRKKNLEKLSKKLELFSADINVLIDSIDKTKKEISTVYENINETDLKLLKRELEVEEKLLFTTKIKVDSYSDTLSDLENKLSVLKIKEEAFLKKLTEDNLKITEARNELNTLSNGQLFSDEEINDLDYQLSEAREKYNELNIQFIRHQNLTQNLQKDIDVKIQTIKDLDQRINLHNSKIKENNKLIVELSQMINDRDIDLSRIYQERDKQRSSLNEAEKQYYNARAIISDKEENIRNKNRLLNQKQIEVNQLKDQFNDIKFKLSGVSERLRIEFDISINDLIKEDVEITEDPEELRDQVEKLRNKLQNFGEINPMAVTAYDEMKERYDTIQKQREDILQAKESLLKTIKEIEVKATSKFMDAFNKVRENFIEVFRSLFTEDDTCDLILLDSENPLDSDIEIIAKPKGKKPKSLSQLSGGEKTLTATALLFSLYLLKPAPFCIFDEVDAPLDDANIQKFNKIIKKFSGDSQFVIVTHNKSTMAAVDVLYGVYMQEQGVSAVTPVDFRSYEHAPVIEVVNN
jgi:chromosome segregation protein